MFLVQYTFKNCARMCMLMFLFSYERNRKFRCNTYNFHAPIIRKEMSIQIDEVHVLRTEWFIYILLLHFDFPASEFTVIVSNCWEGSWLKSKKVYINLNNRKAELPCIVPMSLNKWHSDSFQTAMLESLFSYRNALVLAAWG